MKHPLRSILLATVLGGVSPVGAQPAPHGEAAADITFAATPQSYAGRSYRFLGDGPISVTIPIAPAAGHFLALDWGAKNDRRSATITLNGKVILGSGGGHDGFRWLAVPVPEGITGDRYDLKIEAGGAGKPAFLAALRITTRDEAAKMAALTISEPPFAEMRAIWDRAAQPHIADPVFRQAEANGRHAAEAFFRCRKFIDGWLAHADPATGLIPRNLRDSRYWNGRDSAADNYPFMVLTAAMTDRPLFEGRMLDMLRTETRLTCRIDRLPDDWSFAKQGWRREAVDMDAIIFDGAEYVKDGLIPITEWLGPSPWSDRAIGIVDDIWKHARIDTPFGRIPTLNFEVNGDLLQACSRLFWFTGDRKYLDWAVRLGDYYLLGDQHPTRDMDELSLGDHSCEVVNGLSELYVACAKAAPEKREAYRAPLHALYNRILEVARNEHGMIYLKVNPRTGTHDLQLTDNWGYNYDGIYTVFLIDGTTAYRDAVRKVLGNLKAHYTGQGGLCQSNTADGYADSIEGALTLLNREPVASAFEWVESEIRVMWARQKPDGVIEGWHGDGNFARTSLMYALWKSQGCRLEPWRPDLRIGAVREGDTLRLVLAADQPWTGKLRFDAPRHRSHMRLPLDYPRINQFPEWFTVDTGEAIMIETPDGSKARMEGPAAGFPLDLEPGRPIGIVVRKETRASKPPSPATR
jgi:hypothetical protein